MPDSDYYKLGAEDAVLLERSVLAGAGLAADVGDGHVAARALANALVIIVQEYLEINSDEHDVELFFEVNGSPPPDIQTWPTNILAGLRFRRFPDEDRARLLERAVNVAVELIRSASPLAWAKSRQ
jgi:hypothetical protein